jgi:lycopene cyclase domain-containing protein
LGVWGFNPQYHSSIVFFKLPIEEWLFFIIIPYASIFLHDAIILYFSQFQISNRLTAYLSVGLILLSLSLILFNLEKAYTTYIFSLVILVLLLSFFDKSKVMNNYYCTFLVILIPFILVNAILTGSFIAEPVVWYDNNENLGIRILTIPIEDFGYAFSLILFNLLLRNKLKRYNDGL